MNYDQEIEKRNHPENFDNIEDKLLSIAKTCDNLDEFYIESGLTNEDDAKEFWDEYVNSTL
jgi:hypothetical protein